MNQRVPSNRRNDCFSTFFFFFSYDKRKLKILEILRRGGRLLEKIDIS